MINETSMFNKLVEMKSKELLDEMMRQFEKRLEEKLMNEVAMPMIKEYVKEVAKDIELRIHKEFAYDKWEQQIIFNFIMKDKE